MRLNSPGLVAMLGIGFICLVSANAEVCDEAISLGAVQEGNS